MPTLVFEIEDGSQVVAPLDGRTTIGSAEGNDVVAEREDIAPHHAEVFMGMDDAWWVRDNNSTSGTFLNGTRVTAQRLSPGDLLLFGSISARFACEENPPPEPVHLESRPAPGATESEIEKKRLELSSLEKTVREQETLVTALRAEAAKLEPAVESRRQEISRLNDEFVLATAGFKKAGKEQEDRLNVLREEAAKLEAAVGGRKQELSALAGAQAEMEKSAKAHEGRVVRLQKEAVELESDIGRKKNEITGLSGALQEAGKIIDESRSLVTGLQENRKKHEDLAKALAEAAGRHDVISHQVRTLSEQQRTKLVEMERLERDLADLEARRSAASGMLEHHETERLRAEESLKLAAAQSELLNADLAKLAGEKSRLTGDVQRLGEQCGSLGLEISVMETRKSELRGVLDGLDQRHAEGVKKLHTAAEKLANSTTQHDRILADIQEAAARHLDLQTEAAKVAGQIQETRSEIESHTSTRDSLISLNEKLQAGVATVGQRLAELSGTEDRLLQARSELHRAEETHLSLTHALGELTRKHDATGRAARELEAHVGELEEARDRLEQEIPGLKSGHAEAQGELTTFKKEAEETRRALTDEIERLRADAASEQAQLGEILQRTGQARRHQTELEQQNREMEGVTKQLGETQARFRMVELEKSNVEARLQVLRRDCADTQSRLSELESVEKTTGLRVSRLTSEAADLQNALKQLGDEQQRERKRFEELRDLSRDAEREGSRQREQLEEKISELHAEIARHETRLAHARGWNVELDQLYEKLGGMPEGSPEARAAWLEIQKRKKDIAEQLPTGIQVRPQSRPTVVPRGR